MLLIVIALDLTTAIYARTSLYRKCILIDILFREGVEQKLGGRWELIIISVVEGGSTLIFHRGLRNS